MNAPVTSILDQFGRQITAYSDVFQGAQISRKRGYGPAADRDSKYNVPRWSRRQMLSICRALYANVGFVKGSVRDISRYAVGSGLKPQSQIANPRVRAMYEEYFNQWSNIPEVRNCWNYSEINRLRSIAIDVDGEIGQIYTETPTGYPKIQVIESHRIDDDGGDETLTDSVRLDAQGAPRAYSIRTGETEFKIIGAENFALTMDPDRCDQTRGITAFHHALNTIRDIHETLDAEKLGVKINSTLAMIIKVAQGEAATSQNWFGPQGTLTVGGEDLKLDRLLGGAIPRLMPGEDISSHKSDRPSPTFTGFLEYLLRDCANGLGVPWEFVWDASKLGGSTNRLAIHKAQRKFEERQATLIKLCSRDWRYVVAKGAKRGDLPYDDDWWRVRWQTPRKITVDEGRDAKENRNDIFAGLRTVAKDAGERGEDWEDERDQQDIEIDDLLVRASAMAKKHKLPVEKVIEMYQQRSANPAALTSALTSASAEG